MLVLRSVLSSFNSTTHLVCALHGRSRKGSGRSRIWCKRIGSISWNLGAGLMRVIFSSSSASSECKVLLLGLNITLVLPLLMLVCSECRAFVIRKVRGLISSSSAVVCFGSLGVRHVLGTLHAPTSLFLACLSPCSDQPLKPRHQQLSSSSPR
jgi:hypothetical protein